MTVEENGKVIAHTVDEISVPEGYIRTVSSNEQGTSFVIENTHLPEETKIPVEVVWNDQDNQNGTRPDDIRISLLSNGEVVEDASLSDADGWRREFFGLPKYANGEEIDYAVIVVKMAEGYTYAVRGNAENGFTVTCTSYIGPLVVPVEIIWDDADDQDGMRPDSIEVQLYAIGIKYDEPVTLNENNNWKYVWTRLNRFENGEEIVYTVDEVSVPEGYVKSIMSSDSGYSYEIVNNHQPEQTKVNVQVIWDDEYNLDGTIPEYVKMQLTANGENKGEPVVLNEDNEWKYTWEDLDKYAKGEIISYIVNDQVDFQFDEGEASFNTGETETSFIYKYRRATRYIFIRVEKVWNDLDNIDIARPESVTVILKANGKQTSDPIILSDKNGWSGNWDYLLPNKDGLDIYYEVEQLPVAGYTDDIFLTPSYYGGKSYTIRGTHNERPVSISKVDAETAKEVAGAKLQVLDKDGNVVTTRDENGNTVPAEWTSTADGKPHIVYGLTPGEIYTLHEAEAPEGYEAAADSTFQIVIFQSMADPKGVVCSESRTIESSGTVTEDGVILCEGKALPKTNQTPVCTVSAVDAGKAKTFAVTGSYGALTVKSSNAKVATATVSGTSITVKGAAVGTATLTITAAGDKTHNAATITCTVKVTPAATGKLKAAAAANGKGFKLTWAKVPGATGYVIYRNDKKIKTVGNVATYTDAKANTNGAKYTYKVYAKAATGTSSQFKSVVTYKVTRPAIKALANSAAGKMTAKWSKNAKATGYQLQYCTKSTFKGKKTITMPKNTKVAKTISNLTKGKTYYVRLRTYKKVGGKTYFSAWGVTKKVSIKK